MSYLTKHERFSSYVVHHKTTRIVIEGVTEAGETFRPSDWAERLCGRLASFDPGRMTYYYSPNLYPEVHHETRIKRLVLDLTLKKTNPDIYEAILSFAGEHKLKIHEE